MDTITVQGIKMSRAAAENVEECAVDVATDLEHLSSGLLTPTTLLEVCLDGADAAHERGWRDYVEALSTITTTEEI